MSQNDATSRLLRYLRGSTDIREWGAIDVDGTVKYQHDNCHMWDVLDGRRRPHALNRRFLAQHLNRSSTVYFVSGRSTSTALLMIDVDAHQGQTDALDAVELLVHSPFRDQYFERSTHRRGYHLYVRVRREGYPLRFNCQVSVLQNALNRMLIDHNVTSTVEVKGTCTLLEYKYYNSKEFQAALADGGLDPDSYYVRHARRVDGPDGERWMVATGIRTRGSLAKVPRLDNGNVDQAIEALDGAPVMLECGLQQIVEEAGMANAWVEANRYTRMSPMNPSELEEHIESGWTSAAQLPTPTRSRRARPVPSQSNHTGCVSQNDPDAFTRTRTAAFRLAGELGRVPMLGELQDYYAASGYASGPPDSRRLRRMGDVLRWLQDVFDPAAGRPGFETRAGDLLAAVRAHVRPEHQHGTRTLAGRDLAFLLYVVERGSFDPVVSAIYRWTLSHASVAGMAERLSAQGCDCGGWANRNKFSAAKRVLERAELIHRVDERYLATGSGNGVAMRYHIGRAHPLYAHFKRFCATHAPEVRLVKGDRYCIVQPYDGTKTTFGVDLPGAITISQRSEDVTCDGSQDAKL